MCELAVGIYKITMQNKTSFTHLAWPLLKGAMVTNNKGRLYSQFDSRKQAIAFWGRVTARHKGSSALIMKATKDARQMARVKRFEIQFQILSMNSS